MKLTKLMPVITIQGPTAVGKSNLAMQLAKAFKSEIISADSRQVYQFMNIGTAKPSPLQQHEIPHHLLDIITPDMAFSAGEFVERSEKIISNLTQKGTIPIVVGGTGFYIKSLLEGLFQAPKIPDEIRTQLGQEYEKRGFDTLYQLLKKVDSISAKRIAPNDKNRLLRALEVYVATGKSISEHWKEQALTQKYESFDILIIENRSDLYKRIDERVLDMLEKGLIKEFQLLLEKGYTKNTPGMNSVGYKELFAFWEQAKTLPDCVREIQKHTRHYAKRQFTWYNRQSFDLTLQLTDISFSHIQEFIKQWMKEFVGS